MSLEFIRKYDEEMTQEELTHFENWIKDESYFTDYNIYNLLRDETLIRIYKFVPTESQDDPLFNEDGEPLAADRERILPLAKVIKVGPKGTLGLKPGDIVSMMEAVGLRTYNPEYWKWLDQKSANPGFDEKQPPLFLFGLEKLQSMMFIRDKVMGHQDGDELTYLIPEGLIRTGVNFENA